MRSLVISCLIALATLAAGERPANAQLSVSVGVPPLVYVQPGISVIPDYDVPVFYGYGSYWRWYEGYWYRSPYYTHGWAYDPAPPRAILRINRPYGYVHYRPYGYAYRYRPLPQRDWRLYRDHYYGDRYRHARPGYPYRYSRPGYPSYRYRDGGRYYDHGRDDYRHDQRRYDYDRRWH